MKFRTPLFFANLLAIAVTLLAFSFLFYYIWVSDSNHTGLSPYALVVFLLALLVLGAVNFRNYRQWSWVLWGLCIMGMAILIFIDVANIMLPYDVWGKRGMPVP